MRCERMQLTRIDAVRYCARCLQLKPTAEFHRSTTGQFSYCRDCRNEYDRLYYSRRGKPARLARQRAAIDVKRAWMAALKDGVPCTDCGDTFPVYVMHWDHLPGNEKLDDISAMVASRAWNAVLEEIKKCELVCANCHVMRTVARMTRTTAS